MILKSSRGLRQRYNSLLDFKIMLFVVSLYVLFERIY
jgi:hypothetical protein